MTACTITSGRESDFIVTVLDQNDLVPDRFWKKIERFDQRFAGREKRGNVLMPRRSATIEQDIPLYLIPHIVMRGVRTHGEELERVIVRRGSFHFSHVSIRSRAIKRELKRVKKYPSGTPEPDSRVDGEEKGGREGRVDTSGREGDEHWGDEGERI
jgi:hypothetical protein